MSGVIKSILKPINTLIETSSFGLIKTSGTNLLAPDAPPAPPAPGATGDSGEAVKAAAANQAAEIRKRKGFRSTILTGSGGTTNNAAPDKQNLLG